MKTLFVYPKYPDTFWGFRHALKFVDKKVSFPPLGLLMAAILRWTWEKRLIDMNVQQLVDSNILWAGYAHL